MAIDSEDAPAGVKTSPKPPTMQHCGGCSVELPREETIQVICNHIYCKDCLDRYFEFATKDETAYPPQCCHVDIPLKVVKRLLRPSTIKTYRSMRVEMSTQNRTYCHEIGCATFIAPHSIHNKQAFCQKCFAVTCSECKSPWHFGPCEEGEDDWFGALMRREKWRKCPGCRRVVEKEDGCDHMECRCGTEFCYGCGERFEVCGCCSEDQEEIEDEEAEEDGSEEGGREEGEERKEVEEREEGEEKERQVGVGKGEEQQQQEEEEEEEVGIMACITPFD